MAIRSKAGIDLFTSSAILLLFIALLFWMLILAKNEGELKNGLITEFMAEYGIRIFALVTITSGQHHYLLPTVLLPLFLNVLIYSFGISFLFSPRMAKYSWYKPFLCTMTITIVIGAVTIAFLLYRIWHPS